MCTSPMIAIKYFDKTDTGKHRVEVLWRRGFHETSDLIVNRRSGEIGRYLIPCGKCLECRLEYSRMWADRIILDSTLYPCNNFITLTYDNENLPINEFIDKEGTVMHSETLLPSDLSKFMKDLRRYYEYHYNHIGIKFFGAGEYGDKGSRPHYHIAILNLPVEDKKVLFHADGYSIYTSDIISDIWNKGIITVADVCWESAAYVARYIMKKQYGDTSKIYEDMNIAPEFTRMSRRPAIGFEYYNKYKEEIYKNDCIVVKNFKGDVISRKPPRYFDKLFEKDNLSYLEDCKAQRKLFAERSMKMLEERLENISLEDYNKKKAQRLRERTKILRYRKLFEFNT